MLTTGCEILSVDIENGKDIDIDWEYPSVILIFVGTENILKPNTMAKKTQKNRAIPLKNFIISPLCNMFSKKAIINT